MGEKEQLYDWMLVLTSPMAFNRVRTCDLFTILCTHTRAHVHTCTCMILLKVLLGSW